MGTTPDAAGDPDLTELLRSRLGRRHPVAAIATVSGETRSTAVLGAPLESRFEIGSISKGVTGLLYVDAVERGEVAPETLLGALLPLGDSPAAGVTLASLSTHTSGLPRLAPAPGLLTRSIDLWRRGTNPYGESLAELLVDARRAEVKPRRRPSYSNLGFELLGHAVAAASGSSFQALLRERISERLGATSFGVAATPGELGAHDLLGRTTRGRSQEAWTGEAIGPAGGIRSTIGDMVTLAAALLDGTAPGMRALDPVMEMTGPAVHIGAAWITLESKGRPVTWHNGGTGGFRTWMGLDRGAGSGVVVLSATSASVDRHGFDLLASLAP
jgi:CubicO group peptidase (beta-lactamase class C family)